MKEVCRAAYETNLHYLEEDEIESEANIDSSRMDDVLNSPDHIAESLTLDVMDFEGSYIEGCDYYNKIMLEIGDAYRHNDMAKVGMLLAPHMKKYFEYVSS